MKMSFAMVWMSALMVQSGKLAHGEDISQLDVTREVLLTLSHQRLILPLKPTLCLNIAIMPYLTPLKDLQTPINPFNSASISTWSLQIWVPINQVFLKLCSTILNWTLKQILMIKFVLLIGLQLLLLIQILDTLNLTFNSIMLILAPLVLRSVPSLLQTQFLVWLLMVSSSTLPQLIPCMMLTIQLLILHTLNLQV